MKSLLFSALLLLTLSSSAQYYYKDMVGTKESSDLIKTYMKNKVSRVMLTSYDADNTKSDNLFVQQEFSPTKRVLKTVTATGANNGNMSTLFTYADENGNIIKTVDSTGVVVNTTTYSYDAAGNLTLVNISSSDTTINESEQHIWQWENGKPLKMLRVKNKKDTVHVDFKLDENGNVSEETETRQRTTSRPYYYYYNENNQLTDVVRYNDRAKQLLPEYMFEYSASNQVIQKITVPSNNSDYLIWRYQYNPQGLKTKEVVYSKHDKRNPMGKIEYQYSFVQ
ncbi:MAG: RHS repeat protein [Flavisolibacter sp.]|nr:RHS repeat protein [Flavisolibacter sp.]